MGEINFWSFLRGVAEIAYSIGILFQWVALFTGLIFILRGIFEMAVIASGSTRNIAYGREKVSVASSIVTVFCGALLITVFDLRSVAIMSNSLVDGGDVRLLPSELSYPSSTDGRNLAEQLSFGAYVIRLLLQTVAIYMYVKAYLILESQHNDNRERGSLKVSFMLLALATVAWNIPKFLSITVNSFRG